MKKLSLLLIAQFFLFSTLFGQLTPYYHWTLLPKAQMDEIIGEASGETALHHVIEMVGYQRNRPGTEYSANLRESQYILDKLKEYGLEGAVIERFEGGFDGGSTWDGIKGELWEISPGRSKIADYDDVALMLASGSVTTDVTADLTWIGDDRLPEFKEYLAKSDLKGKIVVTSGSVGQVHRLVVPLGAAGVISIGSARGEKTPLAINSSGIRDSKPTFGFNLPSREGNYLRDRLINGEKIRVRAVVEAKNYPYTMQVPTCVIPGTNPDAGEIIFSAHLFEGLIKQGANDDASGCAVILEVARMLNTMISEGRLPRPQRSIRFIWVPEYSGTIPWVARHRDIVDKTLCNLNLDMVGLYLKGNNSFMCLIRTSYANPHYINDVVENLYTWMGESNREIISNRSESRLSNRIVAPGGSDDPFYFQIDQHYGASDHEVFNDWSVKVPGVMLITWPDLYYHTSEDLPDKLDPTQMKRTAIISAAAAYTVASADENRAIQIAGEVFSNSLKRIGHQLARAMDELANARTEQLSSLIKKTRGYLDAAFLNEKTTVNSVGQLAPASPKLQTSLGNLTKNLEIIYKADLAVFDQYAEITETKAGAKPTINALSELEKEALATIPKPTTKVKESGFGANRATRDLPEDIRYKYPCQKIASPDELSKLINGINNVLDIKKMLDTQFKEESELQDILNFLNLLKEAGLVEIEKTLSKNGTFKKIK